MRIIDKVRGGKRKEVESKKEKLRYPFGIKAKAARSAWNGLLFFSNGAIKAGVAKGMLSCHPNRMTLPGRREWPVSLLYQPACVSGGGLTAPVSVPEAAGNPITRSPGW